MEGRHPFAGVLTNSMLSVGRVELYGIKQGTFPYDPQNRSVQPGPGALDFDILHPELRQLFIRCFVKGHQDPSARPKPEDWRKALERAENSLIECKTNPSHYYSNHLKQCPWCQRVQTSASVQTPSHSPLQTPLPPTSSSPKTTPPLSLRSKSISTLTWEDWRQGVLPTSIFGTLGGLGVALGISFLFSNPNSSGTIGGILAGIVIAVIFFIIASATEDAGWLFAIIGIALAWFGGSFVANRIVAFLASYTVVPGWLYTVLGAVGLFIGLAGGNFKVMKKFNQRQSIVTFSSTALIFIPITLMVSTGVFKLPFVPVTSVADLNTPTSATVNAPAPNATRKITPTKTRTPKPQTPTLVADINALCDEVYSAKSGDSVSKIAGRYLDDILAFDLIVDATNKAHSIDPSFNQLNSPDELEVGDKLCIPFKTSQTTPESTATRAQRPTRTPKPNPNPTKRPTNTPRPTPTPKPTPTPRVAPCEKTTEGEFAVLWQTYREQLGCPKHASPVYGQFAEMPFERGHLFWIGEIDIFGNTKQIIATFGGQNEGDQGTWGIYTDTWNGEGICGVPAPPSGLYLPDRGIAKVWCEIDGINQLGYATAPQEFVPNRGVVAMQNFEKAVLFRDSDGDSKGLVYILLWDKMRYIRVRY
jgi:hypothetical protein